MSIKSIRLAVNFNENFIELYLLQKKCQQKHANVFLEISKTNFIKNKLFTYIFYVNANKGFEHGLKCTSNNYSYSLFHNIVYVL